VSITATVGRYGNLNAINLQIQKREESATNAAFESAYRAAVGKPFYFGFKNGDPVALVVTEVSNQAKVDQGLLVLDNRRGVTTVVLSAVVQDKDLATLRDALTARQIDAVRILLAGDVRIDKSVDDKNGKKMMEKFSCFYQSLDKRGIELSAIATARESSGTVGKVGCPSEPVAFAKIMTPAFAADYEKCTIATSVQFVAAGQTQGYRFGAIPNDVMDGKVAFRALSPGETIFTEGPSAGVLPHVFVAKAASDLVFELKRSDEIVLTGHPVVGKGKVGGQDFIQVVFVADSIRRVDR
jgi:hypothetical protein